MNTPYWSKNPHVYEPSEDTFLFLDCLSSELGFIKSRRPLFVLEMGTGSGILTAAICDALGPRDAIYLACDINAEAGLTAKQTFKLNNLPDDLPQFVTCDLFNCFGSKLDSKIDLMIFNPPYVPTDEEETRSTDFLTRSWAGGKDGRMVIDSFINQASQLISPCGLLYLLLVKENKPDEVVQLFARSEVVFDKVVIQRKCRNEDLTIMRFHKMERD